LGFESGNSFPRQRLLGLVGAKTTDMGFADALGDLASGGPRPFVRCRNRLYGVYLVPTARDRIMSIRPYRDIHRRRCRQIHVGNVAVGGDAPISVQSMTNTVTSDVAATVAQVKALEEAGADIVRVSCPDQESALALKDIVRQVTVPIVADIHFHYKRAIEAAESGAACLRINPGNIGSAARVREVIKAAKDHGCSMRIGVNAGSLERDLLERYGEPCPEAMVESALTHAKILEDNDFFEFKISCKASDVFLAVAAYQQLAEACDYPLHLGITEAGAWRSGTVKSSIGLGMLLWSGIGDTIRVSLSADPVEEVRVGFEMLKALGLRRRGVTVISCPSCARQQFEVIKTVERLEQRLSHITTPMTVSVIGCVVNGPGEARETDIGFTGGGHGTHQIYIAGVPHHRLKDADIVDHLVELVEQKAAEIEAAKRREQEPDFAAAQ
jgi:(E)-4-hydroxy-3-methylbut-2-enyl-diphosphate synthase